MNTLSNIFSKYLDIHKSYDYSSLLKILDQQVYFIKEKIKL